MALGATQQKRAGHGHRPGPDDGRYRPGDWRRRGALGIARVLRSYLYQTTATDPLTFAVVGLAFIVARYPGLPGSRMARDDGRPDERVKGRVRKTPQSRRDSEHGN